MAGGDVWNGTRTTNRGNADTVLLDPVANTLTQGPSMSRPRFYATLTTLPNGEIYIQGGRDGEDRPEIRSTSGDIRPLTGIDTTSLYWWYPRHWVAPDGRIFGFSDRSMYYVDPYANSGNGSLEAAGTMPEGGPSGASSSEAMYAPGKILRVGGGGYDNNATVDGSSAAAVIDINSGAPAITPTTPMPVGLHWHTATVRRRRQGRGHRRQPQGQAAGRRQHPRPDLGSGHRQLDRGGAVEIRPIPPLSLLGPAAGRRDRPGRWGRRAGAPDEPQRREVLSALPLHGGWRVRGRGPRSRRRPPT